MELLCALLTTGLTLLFVVHLMKSRHARVRAIAGPLLLGPSFSRGSTWLQFSMTAVFCASVAVYTCALVALVDLGLDLTFWGSLLFNWLPMRILAALFAAQPYHLGNFLEIRQRGIVGMRAPFTDLLPWASIKHCKWNRSQRKISVQAARRRAYPVPKGQAVAVTETLSRFVEVRDAADRVLNVETPVRRATEGPHGIAAGELAALAHSRFQFSLRTLLLLTLVLSSGLSCFGIRFREGQRQAKALAAIEEFQPRIMRWPIGQYVNHLDFSALPSKPRDADLVHLPAFTRLEWLDLSGAPITDAGLEHVGKLPRLKHLQLSRTQISDAGLVHLERLSALRWLTLHGTHVTEEGVQRLQEALPNTEIDWH